MTTGTKPLVSCTGRRKNSVARAHVFNGKGKFLINGKTVEQYFAGLSHLFGDVFMPLEVTKTLSKYDIVINVVGGGTTGQAQAIRHAVSRALVAVDESNKPILKKHGLLTRDPRVVERKKPGRPKARKRFQFSKR